MQINQPALTLAVSLLVCSQLFADDSIVAPPSVALKSTFKLSPFYKKSIVIDGFPIVSSERVSDYALREAAYIVRKMLAGRDDILHALAKNNVRLAIMATTEMTCDIPEHSDLDPPAYWNKRARGLGSTPSRPAVSCGEENLLEVHGDPYQAESILVHEFAHAIHEMGLNLVDKSFDSRLRASYQTAIDEGLWKGTYAATNPSEYWAEGVQSWFDTNRCNDNQHNEIATRDKLIPYDPRLAKLLSEVFVNNDWRYVKPTKRPDQAHLVGFDRNQAPEFAWPPEVVKQFDENEKLKK